MPLLRTHHIRMSHMNELCLLHEWVMSLIRRSHVSPTNHHIWMSRVNELCLLREWVMSHIWMPDDELDEYITHEWVMSLIWMRHVSPTNESWHTEDRVTSLSRMSHVSHMNTRRRNGRIHHKRSQVRRGWGRWYSREKEQEKKKAQSRAWYYGHHRSRVENCAGRGGAAGVCACVCVCVCVCLCVCVQYLYVFMYNMCAYIHANMQTNKNAYI